MILIGGEYAVPYKCAAAAHSGRVMGIFRGLLKLPACEGSIYGISYRRTYATRRSNDAVFLSLAMKVLEDVHPKVLVLQKGDPLPLQILEQCIEEVGEVSNG